MKCTRFKSLRNTKPEQVVSLTDILSEIASDKYKLQIEAIRSQENPSKSPLKDKLPVFTPTGIFNYRSLAGLEEYNGLMCLDIDHVEDPISLKEKCKNLNLKVMIKSPATSENYRQIELQVAEAFTNDTGAIRDNHAKDIARIQFVSYDPEIYINENCKTINI